MKSNDTPPRSLSLDGDAIRERRKRLGMTQQQVAEESGLTYRTIQTAEAGRSVSADSAQRLSQALSVPLVTLILLTAADVESGLAECGCAIPSLPRTWVRRPGEHAVIEEMMRRSDTEQVVCISGAPGVGKTALACVAAHELAGSFPGGTVWIPIRGTQLQAGPSSQLLGIARACGFADRLPVGREVAALAWQQAFRRFLWSRNILLVLDDVQNRETIDLFVGDSDRVRVIVTTTSRSLAESIDATTICLGPLTEDEGVDLLAKQIGRERIDASRDSAAHIVRLLGGAPRALKLAGLHLTRNRFLLPEEYARELIKPLASSDAAHDATAASPAVVAMIPTIISQLEQRLSPEVLDALGALSILDGRRFSVSWASAVTGLEDAQVRRALSDLAEAYILDYEVMPGPAGPNANMRLFLDSQAQSVAILLGYGRARDAWERLVRFAVTEARAIRAAGPTEAWTKLSRDLSLWVMILDELCHEAQASKADQTTARRHVGDALVELVLVLAPTLLHLAPTEAATWLLRASEQAERCLDDASYGALVNLRGHLLAQGLDFQGARGLHEEAAEAFARSGQMARAAICRVAASRMSYVMLEPGSAVAELQVALDLVGSADEWARLTGGIETCLAVIGLHLPGHDPDWTRARELLERALQRIGHADDPETRLLRAVAVVNLAIVRHVLGVHDHPSELHGALCLLDAACAHDVVDLIRLRDIASTLGVDGLVGEGPLLPSLEQALSSCPPALLGRRLMRLHEFLATLWDYRAATSQNPDERPAPIVVRGTGTTDIIYDTPLRDVAIGPPMMWVVGPFAAKWDEGVQSAVRRYLLETYGAGHPLSALLAPPPPAPRRAHPQTKTVPWPDCDPGNGCCPPPPAHRSAPPSRSCLPRPDDRHR